LLRDVAWDDLDYPAVSAAVASYGPSELEHYRARLAAHRAAIEAYSPCTLSVPVHLFAAENAGIADAETIQACLGWNAALPLQRVVLHRVPGSHHSMMDAHVGALGAAVSRALQQAPADRARIRERVYEPLVAIQSGSDAEGYIACIPGAGDHVSRFAGLADALGART
jgi:hypothetical protein